MEFGSSLKGLLFYLRKTASDQTFCLVASMRDIDIPRSVHSYAANKAGLDFVVGDIHGHFDTLLALLIQVQFDTDKDRLFAVGDVIDRGTQSAQVVDWLKKPWFHSVRGNHEQMIIDWMNGDVDSSRHSRNGGAWFYELLSTTQMSIADNLRELPMAIELGLSDGRLIGIVHAQVPFVSDDDCWQDGIAALKGERGQSAFEQARKIALYSRERFDRHDDTIIAGIDTLYVGHTTVPSVCSIGNTFYVDTGCSFSDGALSIVELITGTVTTIA
ncbi:metallophosphoesterase [Pseudomonas sp. LB3P81]